MMNRRARGRDQLRRPDPAERADAVGPGWDAHEAVQATQAAALGRLADSPLQIPWRGWRQVIRRTLREMMSDKVSLVAAGCAFYGTLALFPAMSMLIALYGLLFDVRTIEPHLSALQDLLPPLAYTVIHDRLRMLVSRPHATLGLRLVLSTGIAIWVSTMGVRSLITALNLAYEETERRRALRFHLLAFAITALAIVSAVAGLAVLVGLPAWLSFLGMGRRRALWLRISTIGLLVLAVAAGLSLLYRYGPSRQTPKWQWVTPGSLLATALWVAASAVFSWYVRTFSTYDMIYGPLGTVAAFMVWQFVTVYVVLLGAELNAELELQTVRDSTSGGRRPFGRRGAYVADHLAED